MKSLLILDSTKAQENNNIFKYTFKQPLRDIKTLTLKKALVNCDTINNILYIRSNLCNHITNKTIASSDNDANRKTNILSILQYDPDISNTDTLISSTTTESAPTILLNSDNNNKLFEGTIFRIQRVGNYNSGEDSTINLKSKNGKSLTIELTNFTTGNSNDATVEIYEWRDSMIDDYQIFKLEGSGVSGTYQSTYSNIGINLVTNNNSSCNIDLKIYETTGTLNNYDLSTTTTSNVNKIVTYKETGNTIFPLNMNNQEIYNLDLSFCNDLSGSPIEINNFNLVFELSTGRNFI